VWTPGRVTAAFATANGDANNIPKYQTYLAGQQKKTLKSFFSVSLFA
jgi:hypothetical protein